MRVMEQTEIEFPHKGKMQSARYPLFGPGNAKGHLAQIKQGEYKEPVFPEVVSFIHHYFKKEGWQAEKIREIMTTKYLVGYTGILFLPAEKEIIFIDYPAFERRSVVDADNLESRLRMRGFRAKVKSENIETGSLSPDDISRNALVIALCDGEDVAQKLAELSSWHPEKKCHIVVPVMENFSSPQARMPMFYSYDNGRSLTISLNGSGCSLNSFAFGLVNGR
jgi:hypothetical protein